MMLHKELEQNAVLVQSQPFTVGEGRGRTARAQFQAEVRSTHKTCLSVPNLNARAEGNVLFAPKLAHRIFGDALRSNRASDQHSSFTREAICNHPAQPLQ